MTIQGMVPFLMAAISNLLRRARMHGEPAVIRRKLLQRPQQGWHETAFAGSLYAACNRSCPQLPAPFLRRTGRFDERGGACRLRVAVLRSAARPASLYFFLLGRRGRIFHWRLRIQ
ncbi:MAG: hypothetical protein MR400_06385 [Clostridiales bacterium]|nr:hypothetical protein [Clostridiales bacterium]